MHRKGIELLIKTTIRRISAYPTINRNPPCSYFHLSRHLFAADQPVKKPASSSSKEPITDFSNLNPDEFGTIAPVKDINEELDKMPEEEDDKVEFIIEDETGRKVRRSLNYYTTLIIKFLNERKIADAIDVLEERMLKRDKVKPNYFVYNLLINGCARVGYTLKAFKLYNEMKKRALKITPATYTALFNACANSPFPDDALIRVNHLRNEMMENGLELNDIQYNALIKAYARLHDVRAAFLVVDEMISRRFPLTDGTFVFLFQACAADKEAGFRHALILMHKMRKKHISPSVFVYNQFLRCVRDCGIGDVKETLSAIKEIAEGRKKNIQVQKQLESGSIESNLPLPTNEHNLSRDLTYDSTLQESSESKDLSILEREENRPNLLARVPHLGSIVKLNEVKTASDRLMLLGGFRNVLEEMEVDNVKPDIKTFTLLLDVIPSTLTAEEALLKELKKSEVHVDIDFYNMLIKKRAFRGDYQNGRAVLELIQAQYLTPDLVTFGVLALCCRTTPQAKQLLTDMNQFRYRLNAEILGGMLANACYAFNYEYVMFVMKLTKNIGVQPNEEYMEHLRKLIHRSNEFFNIKGNRKKEPPHVDNPQSLERYKMFKDYYKQWKEEVTVYVPPHPYEQFKVRTELTEEEEEELSNIENAPDIMKQKFKQGKIEYPGEPTRWKRNRTSGKPHVLDKNFKRPEERRRFLNKNFVRDDRKLNAASEETLTISCESRDDFHSHDEEFMERSSDGISTNDGNYDENYSDSKIRSWQSKNESHYDEMESRGGRRNRIPTNEGNEDENFSKRKLLNWRSKNEYPLDEIESRERNRNQIHYNDRNYNENLTGRKTFNRRMRNNFHSEELESSGRRRNHMQTDYRDDEPNFTRKIVWQRKNEK